MALSYVVHRRYSTSISHSFKETNRNVNYHLYDSSCLSSTSGLEARSWIDFFLAHVVSAMKDNSDWKILSAARYIYLSRQIGCSAIKDWKWYDRNTFKVWLQTLKSWELRNVFVQKFTLNQFFLSSLLYIQSHHISDWDALNQILFLHLYCKRVCTRWLLSKCWSFWTSRKALLLFETVLSGYSTILRNSEEQFFCAHGLPGAELTF